ncbi:ATP-binding protein [Aquimarina sp. Aq107]|uniref:PAS domain-containing sensor histidine kinase n=1 Tax=Aquimarina sp. Aq107 TaxID=1191912 RepID=UPI00131F0944|nr:ATP-binding protein [Aquimarina sp. Aq107]
MKVSENKSDDIIVNDQDELQSLLEHTDELIYQFRYFPEEKKYTLPFASRGLWNVYEVMPEEVKYDAAPAINRIHKDDVKAVFDIVNNSMKTLKSWSYDFRVVLPSKGVRWLRGNGRPIQLMDGSFLWNGCVIDITSQKKKEEEVKRTIDVIESQNVRLMNFAHIATHNLRSYSNNLELLLELAEKESDLNEKNEIMGHVKKVSEGFSDTMAHLNEIVTVYTDVSQQLKTVNLNTSIEKTVNILKGNITQKKAVIINQVPTECFLEYNPAFIESILLNLISNAIKYSDSERNPKIKLNAFHENGRLILQVSDNGAGIDLRKHGESLFGMYKTFHKNKDAVGVGLFLTKNQIEAMGGKIEVKSKVGVGTSFKVFLT